MHESERNRLRKRQIALALAASDIEQAIAAARVLLESPEDEQLIAALETAVSVCYSRAFTWSELLQLDRDEYAHEDDELADLHYELLDLRDKLYAHSDPSTGRTAILEFQSGGSMLTTGETPNLGRDGLASAIELCDLQQGRFRGEIFDLQDKLEP